MASVPTGGMVRTVSERPGGTATTTTETAPVATQTATKQEVAPTTTLRTREGVERVSAPQTTAPQVGTEAQTAMQSGMGGGAQIQTGTSYGMIPQPAPQQQQQQQPGSQMSASMASYPPGYEWLQYLPGMDILLGIGQGNPPDPANPMSWPTDLYGHDGTDAANLAGAQGANAMQGITPALQQLLGGFTGMWQTLENQWNQAMGPTPEASPYMANLLQNFQYTPGALRQATTQNMLNMQDAGAWEQRANNLMATQRENLLGGLNEAERRARGAAARGGYSPAQGLGNAYNSYSQGLTQAARDIYNDSLQQQMGAAQLAGNYDLGIEAQDRGLYNQALQMMQQAGMYDAMNRAAEHTNFGEFAGGVLGAGAAALGGMNEFTGNLIGGLGGLGAGLIPLV